MLVVSFFPSLARVQVSGIQRRRGPLEPTGAASQMCVLGKTSDRSRRKKEGITSKPYKKQPARKDGVSLPKHVHQRNGDLGEPTLFTETTAAVQSELTPLSSYVAPAHGRFRLHFCESLVYARASYLCQAAQPCERLVYARASCLCRAAKPPSVPGYIGIVCSSGMSASR